MDPGISKIINGKTKISFLIKTNPLVIETLASFNPSFNKLKNPILRNLLAPRVNIAEACRIGGCKLNDFLDKMTEIGFVADRSEDPVEISSAAGENKDLDFMNAEIIAELDVQPILAENQDPLKTIIALANKLSPGECLKIINSFEPVPLINMLSKKGFRHHTERPQAEIVITYFIKTGDSQAVEELLHDDLQHDSNIAFERMLNSFAPDKLRKVDVRELEMPLPMITILAQLKEILPDEALFVYHKKVPVFLLPELKDRGLDFLIQKTSDDKVNMLIFRP